MAKENDGKSAEEFSSVLDSSDKSNTVENSLVNERNVENQNKSTDNGTPDPPKKEENPFSFKHFLKQDTSIGTNINSGNSRNNLTGTNFNQCGSSSSNLNTNRNSPVNSQNSYNCTTGARPKVPQTTMSNSSSSETPKMKRSPRFPSFDSQTSLTEYSEDLRTSVSSHANFVQRSYSNYDMDPLASRIRPTQSQHKSPNLLTSSSAANSRNNINVGHRIGNAEFPSALPDFVQDHLVIEQWYSNTMGGNSSPNTSPLSVDFDQIPDFAVNKIESDFGNRMRPNYAHNPADTITNNDMPFDLMFNATSASARARTPIRRNSPTIPLDLPTGSNQQQEVPLDLPFSAIHNRIVNESSGHRSPPIDLPLDLTERHPGGVGGGSGDLNAINREPPPADMIQTLPDFLSDGPIHSSSRLADVAQDLPHLDSPEENTNTTISRLRLENERLRHELDDSRRRLSEQSRRVTELEHLLETLRTNESQYSATLAESIEQVEENLDRSNKRAAAAQTYANKMKQQVKQLTAEIESLRRENDSLKEEGAVGGSNSTGAGIGIRAYRRQSRSQNQQISKELLLAALNAETNLRQLLSGVDNLRILAATIENMDNESESNPDSNDWSDGGDDEDFTGPAL